MVGYEVAADQLRNGVDVVAESVNPLQVSRDAWRDAGFNAGARVVEVEVICSDATEHRRRAEERVLDTPGLAEPTWEQISNREYHSWQRNRLVVDTAIRNCRVPGAHADERAWPDRANKTGGYRFGSHRITTAPEPNSGRLTSFKSTYVDNLRTVPAAWAEHCSVRAGQPIRLLSM